MTHYLVGVVTDYVLLSPFRGRTKFQLSSLIASQ
jgi:hypothetical protein